MGPSGRDEDALAVASAVCPNAQGPGVAPKVHLKRMREPVRSSKNISDTK